MNPEKYKKYKRELLMGWWGNADFYTVNFLRSYYDWSLPEVDQICELLMINYSKTRDLIMQVGN